MANTRNGIGDDNADKLISNDGKILGGLIELPTPVAALFTVFAPDIKSYLSKQGGGKISQGIEYIGNKIPGAEAAKVTRVAAGVGKAAELLIPYTDTIGGFIRIKKDHGKNRDTILEPYKPLMAAKKSQSGSLSNMFTSGYEGNRMMARALKVANDVAYQDAGQQVVDALPNIVVNYGAVVEQKHDEALAAGDAEAAAKHAKVIEKLPYINKAAGAASAAAIEMVTNKDPGQKLTKGSYATVTRLQEYLHTNELDGAVPRGTDSDVSDVAQKIKQAFQEFQKEDGKHPLPSHRLDEVSELVAKEIVLGDMNKVSLFDVIGTGELLNKEGKGFRSDKEIHEILNKEIGIISRTSTIDVAEYLDKTKYTLDDVKAHIQSKDKDERALVAFFEPDAVLVAAGMKKDEIKGYREHFNDKAIVAAVTHIVMNLNERSDKDLRAQDFNADDIYLLRNLAENPESIEKALHAPEYRMSIKQIASNAVMGEDSTYWREKILSGGHKHREVSADELKAMPSFTEKQASRQAAGEAAFSKN